jgi:formamidopyrimidine-DNA glycosylase
MPELPEVETVRRGLTEQLSDQSHVVSVETSRKRLREPLPKSLAEKLVGQSILGIRRRAKYLLIDTEQSTVISHLGMSGSWRVAAVDEKSLKHDHCRIQFSDGRTLIYHDPRRFGLLLVTARGAEASTKWLQNLGLEPLSNEFTAEYLRDRARHKTVAVKNFIMDQKIVVGVGNIYIAEALFHAGLRPQRLAKRVDFLSWQRLVTAIKKVLGEAIDHGGTTLRDYRNSHGEEGAFQRELFVYGRAGEPCKKCGGAIVLMRQTGRSTYYCRVCQK